jgi:hypothetical protein
MPPVYALRMKPTCQSERRNSPAHTGRSTYRISEKPSWTKWIAPALASTERGRAEAIGAIIAGAAAPFK